MLFVYCSFVLTALILVQDQAGSDKETAAKEVEEELTDEE